MNIAGVDTFDATSQQDVLNAFTLMHDEFVAKGIPVYAGEVGLYNDFRGFGGLETGEMLKYYELLGYEAHATGITLSYWDDGGRILDRTILQLIEPATFAAEKSSWKTRSGTASNDTLYVPKTSPISGREPDAQPERAAVHRALRREPAAAGRLRLHRQRHQAHSQGRPADQAGRRPGPRGERHAVGALLGEDCRGRSTS